jgi:signal transduction histidine kinase
VGFEDAIEIDGQFFDHYDLDSVRSALPGYLQAADNTHDDLSGDDEAGAKSALILAVTSLATSAFNAAFGEDDIYIRSSGDPDIPHGFPDIVKLADAAVGWAIFGSRLIEPQIVRDVEEIHSRATSEGWNDQTPVSPEAFGDLWPEGRPVGWPPLQLAFRPRARIIRTIGDRLISGPEAAVIELIKNSHDADASYARVTFVPPLKQNDGVILIEDDGHGMTLDDIEQKWMEPATSDKLDRKYSSGGRRLLGSKGIGRFAASRLGRYLELISSAPLRSPLPVADGSSDGMPPRIQTTRIAQLDWNAFEEARYLEEVRFPVESMPPADHSGTVLRIWSLRDDWTEQRMKKLQQELRRLVSPIQRLDGKPFRIFLDLSQCTSGNCDFDGPAVVNHDTAGAGNGASGSLQLHEVQPLPILDACDYAVDGAFDEAGVFEGTMTIRRAGQEPEQIRLEVPVPAGEGQESCGIVLVRLNIFDREAEAVRSTAERAGFGTIGLREARKLLDSFAGIAIYREGFRIRPYGDSENDWLTLDAKRVQNPTMKIGRNQIAGIVTVDSEEASHLIERSSREGLEENGSFRRLQLMISTLLSEVVEPRRRQFRISAGLDSRDETNFRDIYRRVQMGWSKLLLAKIPEPDRAEAEALVAKESDRLTAYLKRLEERQAQLEAKVTLGLIIGEVMHQGNTPLSFLETETARLTRWWPHLLESSKEAEEDRAEVPHLLNGMGSSSGKLRVLFDALNPLSGARRGQPKPYEAVDIISQTQYLFKSRMEKSGIVFTLSGDASGRKVFGYADDLATAVTNLVDNAIYWLEHHNTPRPSIAVSIRPEADQCVITIADNGVGIPAEFAEQVFDVGFTLKPNGTGLGLSIAREAIARSNGELQLLSSTDGTVFQISLPLEKEISSKTSGNGGAFEL